MVYTNLIQQACPFAFRGLNYLLSTLICPSIYPCPSKLRQEWNCMKCPGRIVAILSYVLPSMCMGLWQEICTLYSRAFYVDTAHITNPGKNYEEWAPPSYAQFKKHVLETSYDIVQWSLTFLLCSHKRLRRPSMSTCKNAGSQTPEKWVKNWRDRLDAIEFKSIATSMELWEIMFARLVEYRREHSFPRIQQQSRVRKLGGQSWGWVGNDACMSYQVQGSA